MGYKFIDPKVSKSGCGNVRATACGDDDWSLSLSQHSVISLNLCLLPLGHKGRVCVLLFLHKIGNARFTYKKQCRFFTTTRILLDKNARDDRRN